MPVRPLPFRTIGRQLLGLLLFAFCLWAQAAPDNNTPADIVVAMDDNYPPYSFRDSNGNLQGISKDLWDLWSMKTGQPVRIVATDWAKAQQTMEADQANVLDTVFRTEERERRLRFSEPYATLETTIFFHQSLSGITNVNDLPGFLIGIKDGDAAIGWLTAHGISNFRKYSSYEAIVKAAADNEIHVFCMEKEPAMFFLYRNNLESAFRHIEKPLYTGQFRWATRKGNDALHERIAQGFRQISDDERKAIDTRWLGTSLSGKIDFNLIKYIGLSLLVVLLLAIALLWLNRALRRTVAAKTGELSSALEALRESEHYNRMLFENSMIGLLLCRMDGSFIDANQAFADIIGCTIPEALRLTYWQITPPEYAQSEQQQLDSLKNTGRYGPYEKEYLHKSGRRVPVRLTGTLVERHGEQFIWSCVEDITQHTQAKEQINFLAFHDALTGLPNRTLAQDRMAQAMARAEREQEIVALMYFDLDNFKAINDSLGHATGDGLLQAMAKRLSGALRETDTISRQGGDEFIIVLPGLPNTEAIMPVLDKVTGCLLQPFTINGVELTTSASIGIAIYPDDGRDFETLLKNADIAMYQAKDAGRNLCRFFDQRMQADAQTKLNMTNGLRRALDRRELLLHYQPLVDLATGNVVGAEALLRWQHPEMGLIPPMTFIPLAEDSGLIVPIGNWVLHEACRQMVGWQQAGAQGLVIAVNLSAVQFTRGDLEQSVISALEMSGINPWQLELELTESILIDNTEHNLNMVHRLKALGVRLSIDDFGTGYSSLSYLKQFAVDKLKIDRSFIRNLTNDPEDAAIVRAIIQMGKSLGLKTLAEGVEDGQMLERLRLFHCDEGQGFHFAKPMTVDQFSAYLKHAGLLAE
ncbi:MAG: EAL domain-containing protein [Burkholderiaceae bacterium]|nr:EAL domain-containing protein [Burkholderiaceae bacterium]